MKWYLKVLLGLWVLSLAMFALFQLIDWDEHERRRVESRTVDMLRSQSNDLERLVIDYALDLPLRMEGGFYFRQYNNGQLEAWSDNKQLPLYGELKGPDSVSYIETDRGHFIIQRRTLNKQDGLLEFFSIFILKDIYEIQNEYLEDTYNRSIFKLDPEGLATEGMYLVKWRNLPIFAMTPSGLAKEIVFSIGIWCILLSIPILIFWVYGILSDRLADPAKTMFLILLLLLTRGFMWILNFPSGYIRAQIFDPVVYNSSIINASLGDAILNYGILIAIALLLIRLSRDVEQHAGGKMVRWSFTMLLVLLSYSNIALFYWMGWDLMRNSLIEFDISESILFTVPRIIGYLIILLSAVFYFLINHLLARAIGKMRIPGALFIVFHIAALALFIQLFPGIFLIFILQFIWYWVLYLSDFKLRFEAVRRVSLEYLLSIGAILSLSFAFLIFEQSLRDEIDEKQKYANKLMLNKDILGEYYLNAILEEISNDDFITDGVQSGFFARQNVREKINRLFVNSYFDQYILDVKLFDRDSTQFDREGADLNYYINRYEKQEYQTDYESIYTVRNEGRQDLVKYFCIIPLDREGHLTIELNRDITSTANVFPALLNESKYENPISDEFDYAIYEDSTLVYGQGRFGYKSILQGDDLINPDLRKKGLRKAGNHYLGVPTNDGKMIVVSSPAYSNRSWVVNFSFIFVLWIFAISLTGLFYRLFLGYRDYSLASKIQLYLTLGFLIPLVITGTALLNTLSSSYKGEITRNYLKRSLLIANNLSDETEAYYDNRLDIGSFSNHVVSVSANVEADLNIYTDDGELITTSQPGIFGLQLLSQRINPLAIEAIQDDNQNILVDESIGGLEFKATYTAIQDDSGDVMAILGLPFFDSKNHLYLQQKEVFGDLLVVFALIFLVALISGNYILGYLIGPLKLVADHIKRTTLEDDNLLIDYDREDEIGLLVKEYNNMLVKLERNKEALARSQKESAWKEIARQVAHEIKNPLTPMRLKVQQLMRSSSDDQHHNVLSSLITQMDSLSAIADSFSEFAKMPAPENSDFDLVQLVSEATDLHRSKDVDINTNFPNEKIMIWADPNILSGILNNLILNAIQSVEERKPELKVSVVRQQSKVEVSVQDNGRGVPEEIRDKIFTTYFSTKSRGSGIGLAVAKKGIENAGGHIWFESEIGVGTTFYFSLPAYVPL